MTVKQKRRRKFIAALAIALPVVFLVVVDRLVAFFIIPLTFDQDKLTQLSCDENVFYLGRNKANPPVKLAIGKAPNTFRVFVFGDSTTWGLPYGVQGSFSYYLKEELQDNLQNKRVQLINLALPSKAMVEDYRELKASFRYDPDLLIIYSGHNEFLFHNINLRNAILTKNKHIWWLRDYFESHSAIYLTLEGIYRRYLQPHSTLRDDEAPIELESIKKEVYDFFLQLLRESANTAASHHVPLLYVVPLSNSEEWAPYRPDNENAPFESDLESASNVDEVRKIIAAKPFTPDHSALASFEVGQKLLTLGDRGAAQQFFSQALEHDSPILRMTPTLRREAIEVSQQIEQRYPTMFHYFDPLPYFEDRYHRIGFNLFIDGMHPNLETQVELGRLIARHIISHGLVPGVPLSYVEKPGTFPSCLQRSDITESATYLLTIRRYLTQAVLYYQQAIDSGENQHRQLSHRVAQIIALYLDHNLTEATRYVSQFRSQADNAQLLQYADEYRRCCFQTDEEAAAFKQWLTGAL